VAKDERFVADLMLQGTRRSDRLNNKKRKARKQVAALERVSISQKFGP
jgi:hypothetical protein